MKFLNKFSKSKNDDYEEDQDFAEDDLDSEDSEDDASGGKAGGGLFGKLISKLKRDCDADDGLDYDDDDGLIGNQGTDNAPGDDLDERDSEEDPESENQPPVQRVQVEGVTDVRNVGDSGGRLAQSNGGDGGSTQKGGSGSSGGQAPPAQNKSSDEESSEKSEETKDKDGGPNLDLDLKSLFAEEEEVDERLKDLADSEEEVVDEELATELRDFLAELEKRISS